MAVDPITAKILAQLAVQAATDEQARKRLLIIILAPIIFLLALIALIVYLISLDSSSSGDTGASAAATPSDRSLFVADYIISHSKSWNDLNTANLIFGKDFDTNYKLRSLSMGSSKIDTPLGGSPTSNEWDSILTKSGLTDPIKNWGGKYSLGQDIVSSKNTMRTMRGYTSAAMAVRYSAVQVC